MRGLAPRLPSALEGLTARFGMGLGVPPPLRSPTELVFTGWVWLRRKRVGENGFGLLRSHVEPALVH